MQRIFAGRLEQAYREELSRLRTADAVSKMWAGQPALWSVDPVQGKLVVNRLGWISILDQMRAEAAALADLGREMDAAGLRDLVLLGMGGSVLAAEAFSRMFPHPPRRGRFLVLDSTDPESILEVQRQIDLPRTMFVVASKSGRTIGILSQFFYFHHRVQQAGIRPPGSRFIAITDGSYLDQLATDYKFRRTYRKPSDIGGSYSALSYFGLVPAALWSVDVAGVLDSAMEMRVTCEPQAPAEANPALELGALLSAATKNGADQLVLLSTPKLVPLGHWIEYLVAKSTGKEGRGIVPVAGGTAPSMGVLVKECVTVAMTLKGEDDETLRARVAELQRAGAPVVEICLDSAVKIGGEYFKWEAATVLSCAALGINPYDEPTVKESKDNTARFLEGFQRSGEMTLGAPRVSEAGIEVYAGGKVRNTISTLHVADALRTFLSDCRPDDYVALLCYVARNANNGSDLDALRTALSERLKLPILVSYGPRYLHSIGQLYKGGPVRGRFVVITSQKAEDVSIPGAKYTFGQFQMAQALGDLEALERRGKPVMRLHLAQGAATGLRELRKAFQQALTGLRIPGN